MAKNLLKMNFFLNDPRATFGALTGSAPFCRVSFMRLRVHRVRPRSPSTSNNHRCTVGRRFVGSDELTSQSRVVLLESRIAFGRCRRHDRKFSKSGGITSLTSPFSRTLLCPISRHTKKVAGLKRWPLQGSGTQNKKNECEPWHR